LDTGTAIKKLRRFKLMSLFDMQEKTGIHYTWLSRIENGRVVPTEEELAKIREALSWSTEPEDAREALAR
jgi:transcriptional regulator with XRE-family HTH domain